MEYTAAVRPVSIRFGPFSLDVCRRQLVKNGTRVPLGSRSFEILYVLLSHPGQVVEKSKLIAAAWPETIVEECNLRVHISVLRKVLETDSSGVRYIENVSGRGYRFLGHIEQTTADQSTLTEGSSPDCPAPKPRSTKLRQLIGRDNELKEIAHLLSESRCVTITGPGGMGKTSLAAAVASEQSSQYPGGLFVVDFAQHTDDPLVPHILANALNVPTEGAEPLNKILRLLNDLPALFILDNCERFVAAVAEVVEYLIQHSPHTDFLVTSREQLRIAWERVYHLEPLFVPPMDRELQAKDLPHYSASHLLLERVRAIQPELPITNCQVPYITKICNRLDGLPLALELAAARVPLVGFRELELRLENRFSFLTKGRRNALPHHQTLEDMIKWSYETLSVQEAKIWRQLGRFSGIFDLKAIQALQHENGDCEYELYDIMDSLISKSLVVTHWVNGDTQFSLLESMRYFAVEQLKQMNELSENRQELVCSTRRFT